MAKALDCRSSRCRFESGRPRQQIVTPSANGRPAPLQGTNASSTLVGVTKLENWLVVSGVFIPQTIAGATVLRVSELLIIAALVVDF